MLAIWAAVWIVESDSLSCRYDLLSDLLSIDTQALRIAGAFMSTLMRIDAQLKEYVNRIAQISEQQAKSSHSVHISFNIPKIYVSLKTKKRSILAYGR